MYPVGDVGVVLDKTGLSGLIIIRSDDEQAIRAAGLCVLGQIQGGAWCQLLPVPAMTLTR